MYNEITSGECKICRSLSVWQTEITEYTYKRKEQWENLSKN